MAPYRVVDASLEHIEPFLADLRSADRDEWIAAHNAPSGWQLRWGIHYGYSRTCLDAAGKPLVMWGGVPNSRAILDGEEGAPASVWLAATNAAVPQGIAIMRDIVLPEQAALDALFPNQEAWSDKRNRLHHRWLAWMGFKLVEERPYGVYRLPFLKFERTTSCALPQEP